MAIVQVTAPKVGNRASYGILTINFDPGGTDGVPDYVAKYLVTKNFTCATDLSGLDVRAALAKASLAELQYFLVANRASAQGDEDTLQTEALKIFDAVGAPI